MTPWATGMRSPCGLGVIDGEFFYTENQGDWMGSGGVWHVTEGSFSGHPAGLAWAAEENSPVSLTEEKFYAQIDKQQTKVNGRYVKPENVEGEEPVLLFEAEEKFPEVKLPAVWLPHGILGISTSEIIVDESNGAFGPFSGQLLVGDQGQSKITRVSLEKVKGEYQGVAFDFRSDFQSGVLRMTWGGDGSLYVGETNRGWGSAGTQNAGLERLVWTGQTPFEMQTVRAEPDGFTIHFTQPVDRESAEDLSAYRGRSFLYKYHAVYGSPTVNDAPLEIRGVKVSDDGTSVRGAGGQPAPVLRTRTGGSGRAGCRERASPVASLCLLYTQQLFGGRRPAERCLDHAPLGGAGNAHRGTEYVRARHDDHSGRPGGPRRNAYAGRSAAPAGQEHVQCLPPSG